MPLSFADAERIVTHRLQADMQVEVRKTVLEIFAKSKKRYRQEKDPSWFRLPVPISAMHLLEDYRELSKQSYNECNAMFARCVQDALKTYDPGSEACVAFVPARFGLGPGRLHVTNL